MWLPSSVPWGGDSFPMDAGALLAPLPLYACWCADRPRTWCGWMVIVRMLVGMDGYREAVGRNAARYRAIAAWA